MITHHKGRTHDLALFDAKKKSLRESARVPINYEDRFLLLSSAVYTRCAETLCYYFVPGLCPGRIVSE